ncbi:hypothetical protein F3Y22_tig00111540pilonHSYRG00245 [Hibiscus syriacus]|uniref:Pectinesterase n=1 Tax=Hibiscus syriacus TaxID=106335 RepID=A0A6A2YEA7_HIBSY|nr:hypothetical protein F3Y22_tig00111540pilonHSYRG00245 [Hibiscus syriacus]
MMKSPKQPRKPSKRFENYTDSLVVRAKSKALTKMALDDCKEMMNHALDSLEASRDDSCLDGFEHDKTMKEPCKMVLLMLVKSHVMLDECDEVIGLHSNFDRHLLARTDKGIETNAVVAKDGGGQFKTIGAALAAAPKKSNVRHMIYIKAGVYEEYITVDKRYTNILMYGDGPRKTIVTGRKAVKTRQTTIWRTATFYKSSFFNCRIDGFQDTLYNQANRQFFRNCVVSGTVDFIFGDTHRYPELVDRCEEANGQSRLYRTKSSSRQVQLRDVLGQAVEEILDDRHGIHLGDLIKPEGWISFEKPDDFESLDTLYYSEYNNRGPGGSNLTSRVNWNGYHKIDRTTAKKFTTQSFLLSREEWLPLTGIPFTSVLRY